MTTLLNLSLRLNKSIICSDDARLRPVFLSRKCPNEELARFIFLHSKSVIKSLSPPLTIRSNFTSLPPL